MTDWDATHKLVQRFTRQLGEEVDTSTGPTRQYLDGQALILNDVAFWAGYFNSRLAELGWPTPIMTGRSGAFLQGFLRQGVLLNLRGREEGPQMLNPYPLMSRRGAGVVLVDDVCFTRATLDRMFNWATAYDLNVIGELVALPLMDKGQAHADRLG